MSSYAIQMTETQKDRIVIALLEYAIAHPEIPDDNFTNFVTDHPLSLAEMIKDAPIDQLTCLFL